MTRYWRMGWAVNWPLALSFSHTLLIFHFTSFILHISFFYYGMAAYCLGNLLSKAGQSFYSPNIALQADFVFTRAMGSPCKANAPLFMGPSTAGRDHGDLVPPEIRSISRMRRS